MPIAKRSIFSKTALIMISLIILSVASGLIISIQSQNRSIQESLVEETSVLAAVAAKAVEAGYVLEQWPFETLKEISDLKEVIFLWVINSNGEIYLADDPEMWGKIIEDSDLGSKNIVVKDSFLPETNEKIKLIIHPIFSGTGGSLFLGVSMASVAAARNEMILMTSFYFLAIVVLSIFLAFRFARGVTNPIKDLVKGAEAIGAGNLDYRLNLKTNDEIEEVANAFDKMALDLGKSKKALQERVEELERFHNLTVGRELKMIELKKNLKELAQRSKQNGQETAIDQSGAIRVE